MHIHLTAETALARDRQEAGNQVSPSLPFAACSCSATLLKGQLQAHIPGKAESMR